MNKLNILALEPYYGGSHKAFLDKIASDSPHNWNIMTLPAHKWKWRMMHSAYTFAEKLQNIELNNNNQIPDVIFCSDMLNLAEFKGLASKKFASIPCIAYFHENQLAYPTNYDKKKDRYFGWINITTALAADSVWFNSEYHKNVFIHEVKLKIKKAPDQRPKEIIDKILQKSHIVPQGVKQFPTKTHKINGPLKILWAARWEFDKNPEGFFDAVRIAKNNGADFRISVLGGGNAKISSEVFAEAEKEFAEIIDNWGFLESQEDYEKVLMNSDIVVSTAHHEFFGISVAEAVSAGCFPIVPHELAYPEVLQENSNDIEKISFFFDGSSKHLAEKIIKLSKIHKSGNSIWEGDNQRGINKISRFYWTHINKTIDNLIHNLI